MSFRFFRPWEDGGQGNTRQTLDPRHAASTDPSKTTTPPQVRSFQAKQRSVSSEEATRSAQVLSDIPGPFYQEKDADRTERKYVWNTSPEVVLCAQNYRVSHVTAPRQTSAHDSNEDTNNKGKVLDCIDDEAANYSQHNCKLVWKSSCPRDKHSSETHKTRSSIASSPLTATTPTSALQNGSVEVASADASLTFGSTSYSLNSLAHSGSLVSQNYFYSEAALDMFADATKDISEMNQSKVVEYSSITKQEGQSPSPSLKEEYCAETFPDASRAGIHEHRQTELKPFQTCGKSFSPSATMHQHGHTHMGSKHFQCSICEKTFSCLNGLLRHKRIHSGSKPFKCSVCQKAFRQSSDLRVHERIHTGSKPFKCSICQKAFRRSAHLHEHERIHTGYQPFKCSICQKAFTKSGNLHVHEQIHTGSKPFKCFVCDKAFNKSCNLHSHERIHTGSKPFKCSVCGKAFTHSNRLRAHKRLHSV